MYRIALCLIAPLTGCLLDDAYCNDAMAGAPACDGSHGSSTTGGGPSQPPLADATLAPMVLGDRQQTTWIAAGGDAEMFVKTHNLTDLTATFRDVPVAMSPGGGFLVQDVADLDVLKAFGTSTSTGEAFERAFRLRTVAVSRVALAPSGTYARLHDNAPLYLRDTIASVQLWSVGGDRLVDQSLHGGGTLAHWDLVTLPGTASEHAITLTADSFGSRTVTATVVAAIDRLETSRRYGKVCFHAMLDTDEVFVRWTVTVKGVPVELGGDNCMAAAAHTATVVASAGGLTLALAP